MKVWCAGLFTLVVFFGLNPVQATYSGLDRQQTKKATAGPSTHRPASGPRLTRAMLDRIPIAPVQQKSPGHDPRQWQKALPESESMRFVDLSPGVDLILTGSETDLVATLLLNPGADPDDVRLGFQNTETVTLDASGNVWAFGKENAVGLVGAQFYQLDKVESLTHGGGIPLRQADQG
ncbi:MAG: hypothetical protein HY650_13105 [Acidobacteria bacterium]|nr:hypothetical protein [Acidobacteriota bacterium]